MTTPLFMPLLFTSHSGTVHFEGRPLDDFSAVRMQVALRKLAIEAEPLSLAEHVYHVARDQALEAIRVSRKRAFGWVA